MGIKREQQYEQLQLDVGQDLTLEQYANVLHCEKDGFITVARKSKSGWRERSYSITTWKKHLILDVDTDIYFSVNSLYKPVRGIENLRHLESQYIDLDIYNVGLSKEDALKAIDILVETGRIPKPTFIIDSGRGLYLYWKIESAPGKFKNVLKLYSRIQRFLYGEMKKLGADPKALDAVRVLRVAGSRNTKNGQQVKVLEYNESSVYTLRFMQEFMNESLGVNWDEVQKDIKKRKRTQKKRKTKIHRLFTPYSLAVSRARDLEKLCELRGLDILGYLNSLLHIYCYQMMCIHKDFNVARHQVKALNDSLVYSVSNREITDISTTVYRAYKDHLKDKTKGYLYKNETIIELLDMTTSEQKEMKTIISIREKYDRNNERRTPKGVDGLTNKQRQVRERRETVNELKDQGYKQAEIAVKLGVSVDTIKKDYRMIKG